MAENPTHDHEFGPLMIAIENVTAALGEEMPESLRAAITELETTRLEFACCCRLAHVVKDSETGS